MNIESNDFFYILNEISITTVNNDLKNKDKILKKIELIKYLKYYDIDVFNYDIHTKDMLIQQLHLFNNKLMSDENNKTIKINKTIINNKLNTILGKIINNAYISSVYQVLISNIPYIANEKDTGKECIVCSEYIYDTLIDYLGEDKFEDTEIDKINVVKVLQIDTDKYLVCFKDIEKAKYICNLLNNMEISENIIRVEILDNTNNKNYKNYKNNSVFDFDFDINIINKEKSNNTSMIIDTIDENTNTNTNTNTYSIIKYYMNLVFPYIKLGFEKTYTTLIYISTFFTNKTDKTDKKVKTE